MPPRPGPRPACVRCVNVSVFLSRVLISARRRSPNTSGRLSHTWLQLSATTVAPCSTGSHIRASNAQVRDCIMATLLPFNVWERLFISPALQGVYIFIARLLTEKRTSSLPLSDGLRCPLCGSRPRDKNKTMYFLLFIFLLIDVHTLWFLNTVIHDLSRAVCSCQALVQKG